MIEISISIILSIGIANAIITFACFIFVHRSLSDVRVLFLINSRIPTGARIFAQSKSKHNVDLFSFSCCYHFIYVGGICGESSTWGFKFNNFMWQPNEALARFILRHWNVIYVSYDEICCFKLIVVNLTILSFTEQFAWFTLCVFIAETSTNLRTKAASLWSASKQRSKWKWLASLDWPLTLSTPRRLCHPDGFGEASSLIIPSEWLERRRVSSDSISISPRKDSPKTRTWNFVIFVKCI